MNRDLILILDFGGNQAYYTARKLRGEQFYCEILPADTPAEEIAARSPRGILMAGGESADAPVQLACHAEDMNIPILALGKSSQIVAEDVGAESLGPQLSGGKESVQFSSCALFESLSESDRFFDCINGYNLPEGYAPIASTPSGLTAAFGNPTRNIYCLQFYVESNDPDGLMILQNFAERICGCARSWTVENIASQLIDDARAELENAKVLMPVSSSADTAVTAAILSRAIGNRLTCLYIDTGLHSMGDAERIKRTYADQMKLNLVIVNAEERFLKALRGVSDPAQKRALLANEFSAAFIEEYIHTGDSDCVALGTIYPDVLRKRPQALSGLIDGCRRYTPLQYLFKEDVRMVGRYLGVPDELLARMSFSNTGLAVRCLGEVTAERLSILRHADAIYCDEIEKAGYSRKIAQYFAVLTDIITPGCHGTGYVCALRALGASNAGKAPAYKLPYDLMEAIVTRITSEVPQINHVVYDITGRPTAAVEWE